MNVDSPRNHLPNSTRERSDTDVQYDNHIVLLGNQLTGEVDGKTIGCDDTGLFRGGEVSILPSKKAGPAYPKEGIPRIVHHGKFGYHLKNFNKMNVQFQCDNRQNKIKCNRTLYFAAHVTTNTVPN